MINFINKSGLEFTDISTELKRTYRFRDKENVTIEEPLKLNVSESGGHRIFDAKGNCHYVPSGWIHLKWIVKENAPHFVK